MPALRTTGRWDGGDASSLSSRPVAGFRLPVEPTVHDSPRCVHFYFSDTGSAAVAEPKTRIDSSPAPGSSGGQPGPSPRTNAPHAAIICPETVAERGPSPA